MSIGPSLSAHTLGRWMFLFSRDPLSERDLNAFTEARVTGGFRVDRALDLGKDGVPTWWPISHPETLQRLSSHDRRKWFIRFFADQLSPLDQTLLTCNSHTRRHLIASELFYLFVELDVASLPPPEQL